MADRGARRWRLVRAAPAAIPASVRRFNQRARQRRAASARPWLIAAATLAFLGVASWIVFGTSVLGVASIRVNGGGFVPNGVIARAAGVPLGTPMVTVDTGAASHRVESLTAVARATVRRQWPRTLVINVTLRAAIASSPLPGDQFALVDAYGVPFRVVGVKPDLPVIVTASADLTGDAVALAAAAHVLASLPAKLTAKLVRIDAPSRSQIQLLLRGDRKVIWGDDSDNEQKARVALSLLEHPGTVIDVSAPTVVTVR